MHLCETQIKSFNLLRANAIQYWIVRLTINRKKDHSQYTRLFRMKGFSTVGAASSSKTLLSSCHRVSGVFFFLWGAKASFSLVSTNGRMLDGGLLQFTKPLVFQGVLPRDFTFIRPVLKKTVMQLNWCKSAQSGGIFWANDSNQIVNLRFAD